MTDTYITALVERLREAQNTDHERGCQGREYTCSCGWDDRIWAAALAAADALEAMRNERDEACTYLERLLVSYSNKYCDPVPEWGPWPDLMGMLTQMDNASTVTGEWKDRAEKAEAALRSIKWRSIDKDNMEFAATITYSQMDEIRALAGDEP